MSSWMVDAREAVSESVLHFWIEELYLPGVELCFMKIKRHLNF